MAGEVLRYVPVLERPLRMLDATFGRGGHARRILAERRVELCMVMDRDLAAVAAAEAFRAELSAASFPVRVAVNHGTFDCMRGFLDEEGVASVDLVLMDLGLSQPQVNDGARGFSFMRPGPLDMRMDRSRGLSAADILARASEEDIADIIFRYGEEPASRRIARAIVAQRKQAPIRDTITLAELISRVVPRRGRLHPATRSFQALRIAVNREIELLDRGLDAAASCLKEGGRLVAISFHSLEDRMVKLRFRAWEASGEGRALTRSCVTAERSETLENPGARSAKLRCFEFGRAA